MAFTVHAIDGSFAGEARGVQLWKGMRTTTLSRIGQAWQEHGVLVFRRQALSEDELVAFSSRFGELERIVRADWASPTRPEITQISNLRNAAGASIGGLGSGELAWHTDQSYMARPATGAFLYCVEVPPRRGHTYWANLYLAYEALQRRIEGRRAVFSYAKRISGYEGEQPSPEEIAAKTPDVTHPLVHAHPLSGRKALYLDPSTTTGIAGLPEAEGRDLLESLNAHATRERFVYEYEWQVGDFVMWDNGFLLHRREPYDAQHNRLLKQTSVRLPPARHVVPDGP